MKKIYYNHVEGLRGVAVILVSLYHFNSEFFFFGYTGVDIFFVISGYVISISLVEAFKKNYISIWNFYIARFYRLFPALFFCVSIICILLFFFGDLNNFLQNIKTGLTGLAGVTNLYLIKVRSSYFGDNLENIFIHLWSLGVELQFYIFYPVLVTLFFKYQKNNYIFYFYLLVNFCSFFIFLNSSIFGEFANFYSPVIHFWKFGVGTLVFVIQYKLTKKKQINYTLILSALLTAPFLIFNIEIFKAISAFSIFSSVYIILFQSIFLKPFLENKILRFFGLISYSIYLWHLPLIYFNNIYDFGIIVLLFSLIFISTISFFCIERKFRYKYLSYNRYSLSFKTLSLVTLFIFCAFFLYRNYTNKIIIALNKRAYDFNYFHHITKNIYLEELDNFQFIKKIKKYKCASNSFKVNENCYLKNKSKTLIFITGDSTASNFLSSIDELDYDFYLANKSALLFSKKIFNKISDNFNFEKKENILFIKDSVDYFNKISLNYDNSFFVISSHYLYYANKGRIYDVHGNEIKREIYSEYIKKSIIDIKNSINKKSRIVILNNIFFEKGNINLCLYLFVNNIYKYKQACTKEIQNYKFANKETINKINNLGNEIPLLTVFNFYEHLCPNKSCGMVIKGRSVLEDSIHLSPIIGYLYLSKKFNQLISDQINLSN